MYILFYCGIDLISYQEYRNPEMFLFASQELEIHRLLRDDQILPKPYKDSLECEPIFARPQLESKLEKNKNDFVL